MTALMTFANTVGEVKAPLGRVTILSDAETPVLVTPTPAFAALGFGMYTALNNCFG